MLSSDFEYALLRANMIASPAGKELKDKFGLDLEIGIPPLKFGPERPWRCADCTKCPKSRGADHAK